MTYKGPKIDEHSKTRKEIEVPLSDPDKHAEILESLGFVEVLTVSKVREKYYVEKGIIIALDEVEGLGKFIEIEAMTERNEDVPQLIDKLRAILTELGVERFERRSYLELLLEKEGANGGKLDELFGSFIGGRPDTEVLTEIEDRLLVDDIPGAIALLEELKKEQNLVIAVRLILRKITQMLEKGDGQSFRALPLIKQLLPHINGIRNERYRALLLGGDFHWILPRWLRA